ncbi:rRNA biogenesis protein Nop56/Nop58 [Halorubrum ezzemoulense]|uniref:rRNA biogenesis protein Nop56/Nop58 n=1 Tax=Halorubrum ezzemoulense TaxID=337243 RepID=A0A238UZT3_HALEZ|nr:MULTISPECIES: NOP5/NOP56 family protein [Halorubrum]TKX41925.1 NOP58 family protein [Halorubrum sp. CGM4_25_10-8A]TKX66341.1 NOP58 family protein [Halorubrum sp. GN12_10-3_MGM]SNR27812.1 rRNA biogenesis protein Nop56/Nop58 [Halorubrum ezzemoulense]
MSDTDAGPDASAASDGAEGWFEALPSGATEDTDTESDAAPRAAARVREGTAASPADWAVRAVESGFAAGADEYYDRLKAAATRATREAVRERERADDAQLIHAVRAMDDAERTANELAERAVEWAGSLFDEVEPGIEGARAVAAREPESEVERRAVSLAARAAELDDERAELAETIGRTAPAVAPNLSEMAGPELAARLIALAGGLESLAKKPSGTVQVLGAEDALFAHLSGRAPSPKHGIIYTHEYVRGTRPADRGSAARALAGKLTLAARADHYAGERRSQLHADLRERMATIRARADTDEPDAAEAGDE